jgi:hypothetical protein
LVALLALSSIAARPLSTTLRGTVFNDANRNGQRDAGEAALVGIRIQVSTPDLSFVHEYRSGDDGTFGPTVSEGTFTVLILPPDGWSVTTQSSYTVFVKQGKAALGMDFGLYQGPAGKAPVSKPAQPASSSAPAKTSSGATLPTSGGERPDRASDMWPVLGVWAAICGAAFIALTTLAPRARRK